MYKEREIYSVTRGVENEGYKFEVAMLVFYSTQLCYNDQVSDFKIAIYEEHYRPFDDIVINVTSAQVEEKYAFQLKHVKDKLELTFGHFSAKGKLELNKYFKKLDFSENIHVILLTNGMVLDEMNVGSFSIKTKRALSPIEKLLDTSEEEYGCVYEISKDECDSRITFYTSQKDCAEVEVLVVQKLKEIFSIQDTQLKSVYKKFKEFFEIWKKDCKEVGKLDKQDIKMKIAEILFYQHIVDFSPVFTSTIAERAKLLQSLTNDFNVTIIHGADENEVQNLCQIDLDQNQIIENGKNYLIFPKSNKNFKEIFTILWRMKRFPLVLKINEANEKMIYKLLSDIQEENLSFILLGEHIPEGDISVGKIFQRLKDLKNYEELADKFTLSIQGRYELSLKILIEYNHQFLEIITMRELLLMLENTFNVGGVLEDLPKPYIPRRILTTLLKIKVIEENPNDVFVISSDSSNLKFLKEKLARRNYHFLDYKKELSDVSQVYPARTLILAENDVDNFTKIFLKNANKNTHYLKMFDSQHLQLIYSQERNSSLWKYRNTLEEDKLHENLHNKINLICARSGTGKLTLLRYLKNTCMCGYWIVVINFQEQRSEQDEECFDFKMRKCFEDKNRVIYFFYGLQHNKLDDAISYIKSATEQAFAVWIFADEYLREYLESSFNIVSMSLLELSKEERQNYIRDRLNGNCQEDQLEKLFNSFEMLRDNDILGVCLHLYMLTEICIADQKIMDENLILTNIYRHFIESKYHQYLSENACSSQNQIILDGKYYRNEQYKLAAVESDLNKLGVHCDHNFLNQIRRTGDILGIISGVNSDGTVTFSRRTYAHFFAALWLAANHQNIEDLEDLVFAEDHKNIVFMFNLELIKENPLHVAVLCQNYQQARKYGSRIQELDSVGRTPLHLACSGSIKYSKLETTSEGYVIKEIVRENSELIKILDFLLVEFDPLQRDELLHWNLFDYACKTLNLYALEKILPAETDTTFLDRLRGNIATVTYYSVKFGYENLLKLVTESRMYSELLKKNYNGESLLHLAVKTGNHSIVKTLLKGGVDIDALAATYYRSSALHLAAENKQLSIMKLLLENQASVNTMDKCRSHPLHVSASKGNLEATKLLIHFGADVNSSDNFGRTALYTAASKGHSKIIAFLLDNGAKIDYPNKLGKTALACAEDGRHKKSVKLLMKRGAVKSSKKRVHRKSTRDNLSDYTKRPLHWACIIGHSEDIDRLLKENWNIDSLDECYGRTPLYCALARGYVDIVEMLVQRGASVNIADKTKVTPLHWAIDNENVQMVRLFLSNKADVDVCDGFNYTPLHWASMQGNVEIVKLLLMKEPNTDCVDNFGMKPIDWAAEMGHCEIVKLLSKEDNDNMPDIARRKYEFWLNYESIWSKMNDFNGHNPLHYAVCCGYTSLVTRYLQQGRSVDEADDQFGFTPLHQAIVKQRKDIIELLLENDARVNVSNKFNITPLHLVAFQGNIDMVRLLLGYKPLIDPVDNSFCTPLHMSAMKGFFRTCHLLIEAEASINTVDAYGNTPLDYACKKGHVKTVRILLKNNAVGKFIRSNHLELTKKQNAFFKIKL